MPPVSTPLPFSDREIVTALPGKGAAAFVQLHFGSRIQKRHSEALWTLRGQTPSVIRLYRGRILAGGAADRESLAADLAASGSTSTDGLIAQIATLPRRWNSGLVGRP